MIHHIKAIAYCGWLLAPMLLAAQVLAAETSHLFVPEVRRVVFLGDSITYGGYYVSDVIAYQRSREPSRQIEFINVGLSSENTSGLSEPGRKNRALDGAGPELAVGCRF